MIHEYVFDIVWLFHNVISNLVLVDAAMWYTYEIRFSMQKHVSFTGDRKKKDQTGNLIKNVLAKRGSKWPKGRPHNYSKHSMLAQHRPKAVQSYINNSKQHNLMSMQVHSLTSEHLVVNRLICKLKMGKFQNAFDPLRITYVLLLFLSLLLHSAMNWKKRSLNSMCIEWI